MDQFTSLHRRTPVLDNNRLLWRLASDFKKMSTNKYFHEVWIPNQVFHY